jgi:hypothetical protein
MLYRRCTGVAGEGGVGGERGERGGGGGVRWRNSFPEIRGVTWECLNCEVSKLSETKIYCLQLDLMNCEVPKLR